MAKKIGVVLSDEAWSLVENVVNDANDGFEGGRVGFSDVITEMILGAKLDVRALQLKHLDLRRSLRVLASKEDVDVESLRRLLADLQGRSPKRRSMGGQEEIP